MLDMVTCTYCGEQIPAEELGAEVVESCPRCHKKLQPEYVVDTGWNGELALTMTEYLSDAKQDSSFWLG